MWGAGTAIGELPPYFMARAARLSGQAEEGEESDVVTSNGASFVDRAKLVVQRLVQRVGFGGILLCASIPNPLFDLAGTPHTFLIKLNLDMVIIIDSRFLDCILTCI